MRHKGGIQRILNKNTLLSLENLYSRIEFLQTFLVLYKSKRKGTTMVFPLKTLRLKTASQAPSQWYLESMGQLIDVIQDLSHARDLTAIMSIVRDAARDLTGADGATFVLRDNDHCFYADENAISPLWKGRRFPMSACISGWVMMNAQPVVLDNVFADSRIPADVYQSTFVRSMAMVPIRKESPIGAIGNYWAQYHHPTDEQVFILQALANTTSVAMENANLYGKLQEKVRALQESNYELSRFSWVASHDLQEPLRNASTELELLKRHAGDKLDQEANKYISNAMDCTKRLQNLIESLLVFSRAEKVEDFKQVDIAEVVKNALGQLSAQVEKTGASITVGAMPQILGSAELLQRVFQNLISNALKFQAAGNMPKVQITAERLQREWLFSIKDNGIGVEEEYQQSIFGFFKRLHRQEQYPGSGIGLATAKKIVELHNGRIWMESVAGEGSTVFFTLPVNILEL